MSKQRNPNGMGSYRTLKDGRVAWRQTVDGVTREVSAKTPKELQEKVKKIADLPIIKEKCKVDEWFEKWLENYIKPLKKQATYNQYSIIYEQHIKPEIGNRKLPTIKTYDLQRVISKMNDKGLSTWTMKHARKVMSGAFTRAFNEKLIAENPVYDAQGKNKIQIPNKQAKERKTLTIDELSKLFQAMEHSRWIWSVKFAMCTGLRRGELLALKWSDIDWINKRITIDQSNSSTGVGDTKNSKIHYVPLSDNAIECLRGQENMLKQEFNPCYYNDELKKDPFVFPNKSGTMLQPGSYYTLVRRFSEKAGIKAFPHSFRHTFVYLTKGNLPLPDLQNILGHSRSTTTYDIYGTMINDNMSKNIKKIDNVFDNVEAEIQKATEKKEKAKCKVIPLRRVK